MREEEFIPEIENSPVKKGVYRQMQTSKRQLDDMEQIGMIDEYEIYFDDYNPNVYIVYRSPKTKKYDRIIGEFNLQRFGKDKYQMHYSKLAQKWQGKALGLKLYLFLMREMGWIIVSGSQQSPGAKKTWLKVVKNPKVLAWLQLSPRGKKHSIEFDKETGEIEGFISPYPEEQDAVAWSDQQEAEDDIEELYNHDEISRIEANKLIRKIEQDYKTQEKDAAQSEESLIYAMWKPKG